MDYATGQARLLGLFTARQGLTGATEDEDYAGASGTVTFTSGQTTKTVTVQVTNDDVSEDTEFFGFKISRPQGAGLRGQRSEDVANVGLLDDDARGVTIGPTSISLAEPASGETAVAGAYTVKLDTQPSDTVTVTIGGSDPAVSLSGDTLTNNQLTFTTTDWNTAQTITVTPVKDDNAVGETITLTHTLSGGDYAGIATDSVTVNLTDSDTRNLVLSKQSLSVTEGDATGDRYTVKLATQPTDTVTVTISGHDGTDLTLDNTTLTFTVDDWNTAQTVTVKAGNDDNGANDTATLTHTASGGDYVNITKDLPVTITDDDAADIVLSETDLTVTEEDAAGSSYTVKLATQPSATVTVTISGHDGTDPSLSGTTLSSNMLTFTVHNWDTAQTVTVKAGNDDDAVNDTTTLTHTASGGDYANITKDLPVTVTDDDDAGVSVSEASLTIVEGSSGMYTIVLDSQPTADVTVTINDPSNTDVTADPASLTFSSTDWNSPKTVTVNAAQDADADDDTATVTHTVTSTDSNYSGATANSVAVSITDDDDPQVTVSFGATTYTVAEGDTVTVTVTLNADPESTVVIPLTATEQGVSPADYTVPLSVTFDAGDMSKTIAFTATADTEEDDGESVLLGFGTLPSWVSAGMPDEATVTITDDDDCGDADIWCATVEYDAWVHWEGRYDLHTGEVDIREFLYNGEDYQFWSTQMTQNGSNAGDDNHVVLPFGIPERTHFLIDFLNLNGTGHQAFEPPNDDWLDWTLDVSTVSDGKTLTAALRFSKARKLFGAWWRWSGRDIDDLRRAWKPGQLYKLRLVEDPRAQRTPQPLNPPLYLRVEDWVNPTRTWLEWLTPQTRYDRVPLVDSYKIQWKQSSGSWDTAADVSETTRGPSRQRVVSHYLVGLTPGVEYNIRIIATDSVGDSEPSNEITYTKPAVAQLSLSNTPAEGEPRIDGIPELGQTLSADTTAIADADGLEEVVFQYQWLADDADIAGATGANYTLVVSQLWNQKGKVGEVWSGRPGC